MTKQGHILILGDSVFDNTVYIGKHEKDGQARMLDALPNYHQTFLALDGAITHELPRQTKYINMAIETNGPITDVVLSIGGNNLLGEGVLLNARTKNVLGGLSTFRTRQEEFEVDYMNMLKKLQGILYPQPIQKVTIKWHVLGIYYPCYSAPQTFPNRKFPTDMHFQNASRLGVDLFNSVILKTIGYEGFIDLNRLFNYGGDKIFYANPIEPSSFGSRMIAQTIQSRIERNK